MSYPPGTPDPNDPEGSRGAGPVGHPVRRSPRPAAGPSAAEPPYPQQPSYGQPE